MSKHLQTRHLHHPKSAAEMDASENRDGLQLQVAQEIAKDAYSPNLKHRADLSQPIQTGNGFAPGDVLPDLRIEQEAKPWLNAAGTTDEAQPRETKGLTTSSRVKPPIVDEKP